LSPFAALQQETLLSTLGIEVTEATRERVVATMPVGPRVHQPFGLLHGGASVALAETVASTAAWMNVDQAAEIVVGIEINANHLIADEEGRLVCASRCTLAVVPKPPSGR